QFFNQFDRNRRKIVNEIERILDLVRDPGRKLAERGKFLSLNEPILCCAQFFQRPAQFAGSFFHTFKQANVLDRDRGLVGESGDQFDLLISEGINFVTRQRKDADRDALTQHRNTEGGPKVAQLLPLDKSVFGIRFHIRDMHDLALEQGSSYSRATFRFDRQLSDKLGELIREAIGRGPDECGALFTGDGALVGLGEPGGRFDQGLQYGLKVKSRAADHLEHVGGGRLLLQGFTQLAEQPGVFNRNDRLGAKILYELNLLVCKWPNLFAVHVDRADDVALLEHRHRDKGARARDFDDWNDSRVFLYIGLIHLEIGNVDKLFGVGNASERDQRVLAHVDNRIALP